MERGKFEKLPGYDPERPNVGGERAGELGPEEAEFGRNFEAPRQFDSEDEKNRNANKLREIDEAQNELHQISESIAHTTQQLATLPLTYDQEILLDTINRLIAEREYAQTNEEKSAFDTKIEATTKQLAALPTSPEQGVLLDEILGLIDQREKTEVKLQKIYEIS